MSKHHTFTIPRENAPHPIVNAIAMQFDCEARVIRETEWKSASFAGERLVVSLSGERAAQTRAQMHEVELIVPGALVCDLTVLDSGLVEILTLVEG
jgi:hypothetical protein